MNKQIQTVKCTRILAQVNLGFYDEAGNLVDEATFPQVNGNVGAAQLFHPHQEQLGSLIDLCVQQAWEQIQAPMPGVVPAGTRPGLKEPGLDLNGNGGERRPTMSELP